jgi:hypothetical protein
MSRDHERELLGAYALGVLDPDEVRAVDAHVAQCPDCRRELDELEAMKDSLGEVPPEAFLDGPPDGGDLLLQRTLRQVRTEKSRDVRQRGLLVAAGVAALVAAALGGGVVLGHRTASTSVAGGRPTPAVTSATASTVPGTRVLHGSNPANGVTMTVTVTPAKGWVRLHATVDNVKPGLRCQLVVRDKSGNPVVAGSWLVPPTESNVDGSALVAQDNIASVEVVTFDNQQVISVSA